MIPGRSNIYYFLLRNLLVTISIIVVGFSCQEPASKKSQGDITTQKPNVVLIVSDDHGTKDLGTYGNLAIKTPNLDYLASEGVRFDNAYCTTASCSASRSVILTGLYNHANGHFGHQHNFHHFSAFEHVQSLPVLLKELGGYRTGRVGKYHLAPENVFQFEEVIQANSRNTVDMAENSRKFIEGDPRPFFLYFCSSDPHRSGDDKFTGDLTPNPFGNKEEGYPGIVTERFTPEDVVVPPYLPDTKETREELAQYYQSVSRLDQGIGTLFDILKESGKWDNTVILYISDNGIAFAGAKTTLYQPGINLPLLVKNPKSENAGTVSKSFVNWTDLTPTILDFAGVLPQATQRLQTIYDSYSDQFFNTANKEFHGRSFKLALVGDQQHSQSRTFASHTFHEITMYYPMRAVIRDRYKLVWNIAWQLPYPHATDLWASSTFQSVLQSDDQQYGPRTLEEYTQRPEFELYDLESDPWESTNLASDPEYWETLESLKEDLRKFQSETNDPWAAKWIHE